MDITVGIHSTDTVIYFNWDWLSSWQDVTI